MNRRLMRPNLSELKDKMIQEKERDRDNLQRKSHPPTDTFAESYYYLKQMSKKTLMSVVLVNDEVLEGYIEWYDRSCIKLNRDGAPNLLVFKSSIRYICKREEEPEPAAAKPKKK